MNKQEIEEYFNEFSITLPSDPTRKALYYIKVLENDTDIAVKPNSRLYKSLMYELQVLYNTSRISDRSKIAERLVHSTIGIDFIPYMIIYSKTFIDEYFYDQSIGMRNIIFDCLNSMTFNIHNEYSFLRIVKSHQLTIEDYVKEQLHSKKDDKFFHIVATHLYTAKRLEQLGVQDYRICINFYNPDGKSITHGSYHKDVISIYSTPDRTLHKMIYASEHEVNHADQAKNIHYLFIDKDPDIDIYTKDKFIKQYSDDYYQKNYSSISYEYDADFKARITLYNLEAKNNLFTKLKDLILRAAQKETDILSQIRQDIPYIQTTLREDLNGEVVHLDDIFESVLKKEHAKSLEEGKFPSFKAILSNSYQIILYEYVITETEVRRKTIQELVDAAYRAKDTFTYDMYQFLIASATNPRKNKDYIKNLSELENIANDSEMPQRIKRIAKEALARRDVQINKEETLKR